MITASIFRRNYSSLALLIAALLLFTINGAALAVSVVKINNYRTKQSEGYYKEAQNIADLNKKLVLLIKSDVLSPNDEKKLEIAKIYLSSGNFSKAEAYFRNVENENGYIKYAEAALLYNKRDTARQYIAKIDNSGVKHELQTFLNIISEEKNNSEITEIPVAPETDLGIILKAINTGDYSKVIENTVLGEKIVEISVSKGTNIDIQIKIAELLVSQKQPILARIVLHAITQEHPTLTKTYEIIANSYIAESNISEALKSQLSAVKLNPADLTIQKKALEYAILAGDQTETAWLKDNIAYLEKIQRN